MALVLKDRVQETSVSTGTGTVTLDGAVAGYQSFATSTPSGSIVYYCIVAQTGTDWEVGYGTFTSPDQLSRTVVYSSSNAGALVNFPAGTKNVFVTYPAEQAIFQETNGDVLIPSGILTVLGANATNPTFTSTLAEFVSNEPNFSQLFVQNQSNDANASADIAAYNNLGDGTSYFIDMGIDSSTFSSGSYPIFQANDGYLYTGGNIAGTGAAGDISRLIIGTSTANSNVVVFAGGVDTNNTALTISGANQNATFANSVTVTTTIGANNAQFTNFAYAGGNLSNAANNTVLVTQAYVDGAISTGFVVHTPARLVAASYTGTNSTYNNGSSGVGATLTATINGALSIDGVTPNVADRVLLIAMSTAAYNGCYTVTVVGTVSTPWQLTRATDFDTAGPGEIANNAYFFISAGTTYKGFAYVLSQLTSPIVVGTTALPFAEFAQALVYTGTAPINVAGQTISLTGVVPVANGGTNLSTFTSGDLIYANAANTLASRAIGTTNAVLVSNGSIPDWGTVALGSGNAVSGTLGATNGGTAQSSYTLGDTLYSSATNTLAKLAGNITTTKKYLQQVGDGANSAAPSWVQVAAADITGLGTMSTQNANAVAITGGSLNNVTIGASTANTGTFTTLNAANITASTLFTGNGSAISAINASNISSGTIDNARTTANTSNSASTIVLRDASGAFTSGNITASNFIGAGTTITSINASNISSGTIANARTTAASANGASTIVQRDSGGNFSANTVTASVIGDGSGLSAINASNISSGTIANARTTAATANGASTIVLRGTSGEFTAGAITGASFTGSGSGLTSIPNSATTANSANGASTIVARDANGSFTANVGTFTTVSGAGGGLTSINASNISSGTVATARLATGTANASTYLRGDQTWASVTSGITITNDTTTNASYYPVFTTATTGTISAANVSSTELIFNPGTNILSAPVVNSSYGFSMNPTTIATTYTIPADYNAVSAGPITINTGVTITVSTGSAWVVV
jgi:hypothetical protein